MLKVAAEAGTQCCHCQTLSRSFQGIPAGGMAPEPWAPAGNRIELELCFSSSSLCVLFAFCSLLLLSSFVQSPLFSSPFPAPVLPVPLIPASGAGRAVPGHLWHHLDVLRLHWRVPGCPWPRCAWRTAAPLSAMKSSLCSRVTGMGHTVSRMPEV